MVNVSITLDEEAGVKKAKNARSLLPPDKRKKYDNEMIVGEFWKKRNTRHPATIVYRKYNGPVEKITMSHGKQYKIKRYLADYINENCSKPEYRYSEQDKMFLTEIVGTRHQYRFLPTAFPSAS